MPKTNNGVVMKSTFSESIHSAFESFESDPSDENYQRFISALDSDLGEREAKLCLAFFMKFGNANLLDYLYDS